MNEEENGGEAESEVNRNKPPEVLIVLLADTVVEPLAMMVELFAAAVAGSTMLRTLHHIRVANDAVMINCFFIVGPDWRESFFKHADLALLLNKDVGGHGSCADVGKTDCSDEAEDKGYRKDGADSAMDRGDKRVICLCQSCGLPEDRYHEPGDGRADCCGCINPYRYLLATEWAFEAISALLGIRGQLGNVDSQ